MKLNVLALGLAIGLFWGVGLFLGTWWVILWDGATGEPTALATLYRGFSISPAGSVIVLAWGLVDGFLSGIVIAWLYNLFVRLTGRSQLAANVSAG